MTLLWLVLMGLASAAIQPRALAADAPHPGQVQSSPPARCGQCGKAMGSVDRQIRHRAVQEFRIGCAPDDPAVKDLFLLLSRQDVVLGTKESFDLILALRRCARSSLVQCLEVLDHGLPNAQTLMCVAVGGLDFPDPRFVELLRAKSESLGAEPGVRVAARVAYRSVQGRQGKDAAAVSELFKEGTGEMSAQGVMAIALVGGKGWAGGNVVSALAAQLGSDSELSTVAALALGALGAKVKKEAPVLRQALLRAEADPELLTFRVAYHLAAGKVTGEPLRKSGRPLMKALGSREMGFDLPLVALLLCARDSVMGPDDLDACVGFLDESDEEVVTGAAKMCFAFGVDAQRYTTDLLQAYGRVNTPHLRSIVAEAIGMVGGPEHLGRLRQLLGTEPSDSVKDSLQCSIQLILLGGE